ncbi:MAG: DNA mismatch repair endonuclease MutL [Ignavibacteriaceae bacterium]|nr:DNA mismatch repair endonuclease MutL [Ignavibacteriaceae bacterium]
MNNQNKIHILPENIANKIAAGEVVQRPESVAKELLENSIDAAAKNIELIIKNAGKSLIQVCDDGIGMNEADVLICIQKHATSKISSYEDLEAINTLGFRGEALSSIAAVSQLEIRTETMDQEFGTLIKFDDYGKLVKEKGSFPKGTCVIVKNLFYNTPARRNFLKSNATELKHIIDVFKKISLSHYDISFKFYNDDELIYDFQSGNLEKRIADIFADNMIDALIPVEERTDYLSIYGYVGKPTLLRKSKGEQYFFLNSRFVINKNLNHAVFNAYENILEKGDYPFFVLFLEVDPKKIDVNIHPSKLEVRFDDEKDIYNFILAVVKKSLATYDLVPDMQLNANQSEKETLSFNPFRRTDKNDFSDRPGFKGQQSFRNINLSDKAIDLIFQAVPDEITEAKKEVKHPFSFEAVPPDKLQAPMVRTSTEQSDTPFIIQLHNKYLLSQIKSGLMIIDQHVAHERILYEKTLKRLEADMPFSQQLLFPRTVQMDPARYAILKEINQYLVKLGFEIKFFGKNTIVIEGVPDDIKSGSEEKVLNEILEEYATNQREKNLEERDNIAKSYSCKASIKAGDRLTEREMRLLIDQLFATSMPYVCPHGRPIVIKISLDEFDRRFGRT